MTRKEKFEALYTVIKAYLARGNYIQYDQRCMDRVSFLTPRRIKLISPEAATANRTLFLDCSSYVGAVYYEAFGYELAADLTWHMIDYVKPQVFYYEFTHMETEEEKAALKKRFIETLEPGDVMTYDKGVGSGHTMIYVGDGRFTHCTSGVGNPDSYDYVNRKSREYECGGLWLDGFDMLFNERRFFNPKNRRVAISRPLDLPLRITENTRARMTDARDIWLGVESTPFSTQNAEVGESVEYKLTVKNTGIDTKKITGTFAAPEGSILMSRADVSLELAAGESATVTFSVKVERKSKPWLDSPALSVNGLTVHTPRVLLGKKLADEELLGVCKNTKEKILLGVGALEAAVNAYGVDIPTDERRLIEECFYPHDSTSGDILTRRKQNPQREGCIYSFFGGTGVSTPEMISYPDIRINKICKHNVTDGDIIVCSDDPYGNSTYSVFYTGGTLVGKTEADGERAVIEGDEVDRFLDSLLGRFAFIAIRPALVEN